jgi:hypothetical protein
MRIANTYLQRGRYLLQQPGGFTATLLKLFPNIGLDRKCFEKERRRKIKETMRQNLVSLKRKRILVKSCI